MMDRRWCEANNTFTVHDHKNKKDNFARCRDCRPVRAIGVA